MSDIIPTAARFLGRVGDYAKYRPTYPEAAIDAVFAGMGPPDKLIVADIGAGTGISARLLAARGAHVIGIEPNPEMRAAAHDAALDVRDATAENTNLGDREVDIVTAFQAFHWFAHAGAVSEFARVLRPGGRVAIVWNLRDERDAFTRMYGDTVDRERRDSADARAGDIAIGRLLPEGGFRDTRMVEFPHEQRMDLNGLLGRARSSSYVPSEGPDHDAIMQTLTELFGRFAASGGNVPLVYRTRVMLADRP
jgi:SAM-dependent methyltransferase